MNYLALCQRLRSEAGVSGTGPAAVTGQSGEMLRIVNWIQTAYEFVQNYHATWKFLRTEFSISTIASTQAYTPAALSITDLAEWIVDDVRCYDSAPDEQYLLYEPWHQFKAAYLFGNNRSTTERPSFFSIRPKDNALVFWAIPNDIYTINGEYFKTADILSGNTDIPLLPVRFHMIIVWKALMYYGAYAAAEEKFAHGQNEFMIMIRELENDQLETLAYGEPLA